MAKKRLLSLFSSPAPVPAPLSNPDPTSSALSAIRLRALSEHLDTSAKLDFADELLFANRELEKDEAITTEKKSQLKNALDDLIQNFDHPAVLLVREIHFADDSIQSLSKWSFLESNRGFDNSLVNLQTLDVYDTERSKQIQEQVDRKMRLERLVADTATADTATADTATAKAQAAFQALRDHGLFIWSFPTTMK